MTIKTNSDSAPDQSIVMTAGQVIPWYNTGGTDNPLTDDVTKIYVTSTPGGQLTILYGQDPTP
jgi:hypothetical protein